MKKLGLAVLALLSALYALPSLAGSANAPFNVIITLTSACTLTTPADISINYTSNQAGPASGTTTTDVTCTNTLPYSLSLNGLAGAGTYSGTDATTNLNYTLAFNATGTGGADLTGQVGNGAAQTVTIGAGIAGNQAGTCAAGSCNNGAGVGQTVYVNY